MENNNISNTDRLKSALCYIPLGWVIIYFIEQKKSPYLLRHIKYWTFLFIGYILIRMILWWLFLPIGWLLFIVYLWLCIFFWMKAYNWENFNIEAIDNIYPEEFKSNQSTSTENKSDQNTKKTDEFDENWNSNETVIKTDNIVVNKIANSISNVVKNVKKDNKDEFTESNDTNNSKKDENKNNDDVLDF